MIELSVVTVKDRDVPQVGTELGFGDRLGSWKARWGIGRMHYLTEPGLYAVGEPTAEAPVLVTANYKMSFDRLRQELGGRDAWLLVLDTKGINVWCAAGKGTFGTAELVHRIAEVKLEDVVSHRQVIVPQLGATGVSAHEVKKQSGFRVVYGPVQAADVGAFLDAGMKATEAMRRMTFPLRERAVLIPMEVVMMGKYFLFVAACFFLLSGLSREGYSSGLALQKGGLSMGLLVLACAAGSTLGPLLLPWLPGRAFSVKGVWIGLALAAGLLLIAGPLPGKLDNWQTVAAWALMLPALTSFVVMNFTGASTYTSLSGVRREMTFAIPLQVLVAAVGVGLWLTGRFV